MTAGRIKRIQGYVGNDEEFLLTYGDGVGNVDVNEVIRFHRQHGKLVTLTAVRPPGRFGELGLANGGVVMQFNEKPQAEGGWINGGFFVVSRKVFDYLESSDDMMFEQAPLRRIAADQQLMAYQHEGFWQPMDTLQEFNLLNRLWNEGKAPWRIW